MTLLTKKKKILDCNDLYGIRNDTFALFFFPCLPEIINYKFKALL